MSTELLKVALRQPEKIASPLAKSLLSSAGSGLGAAGTFKLLSALRPELAEAALWGGVGAGGVLGHDAAKYLANKKLAAWAKKKAAMEKPFKSEYPLVKKANLLARAAYVTTDAAPAVAAGIYGGRMGMGLLPDNPIIGGLLGSLGGSSLVHPLSSRAAKSMFPKSHRFIENYINTPVIKTGGYEKRASLSRAAKGAIGLPLGVMGLGAVHPELFGVLPSSLGGHLSDTVGSNILNSLDNLAKPILGSSSHQLANVGTSLAGLGALGAGAGKLSERAIPVAKKSIMDNPTARKAALAAALFPWTLAVGGGAYLLGKNNSDS